MKHLVIHNLGPISSVDIELNRFNVIIGPQSSGKSTIAKVISTCEWIEKEVATMINPKAIPDGAAFRKTIEEFHKMEDYFHQDNSSYVSYETDVIKLVYEDGNLDVDLKDESIYSRQKICYIPAERNIGSLPELGDYRFKNTNLRSFMFDWDQARDGYTPDNKVDVLGLGYQYYYDKSRETKRDRIQHINGVTYDISLSDASSGLQSMTPLFVMLSYYSNQYLSEYAVKSSLVDENKLKATRVAVIDKYVLQKWDPNYRSEDVRQLLDDFNRHLREMDPRARELYEQYDAALKRLTTPTKTTYIIEEPEQNLFPETQVIMLRFLLATCLQGEHGFTITTHSPYVLYALNNYLLAWLVKDNIDEQMRKTHFAVDPCLVSVWSIKDGTICNEDGEQQRTLQDERGLIRKNYFNNIMKQVMNDFNELLSFDD